MSQVLQRSSIKRKAQEVEQITELINKYHVLAFASLNKVRASQLQELAKRFRSDIFMKVSKNILVKKAFEKTQRKNIKDLGKYMSGSTLLLFSDMNPFKLSILLEKNKIKTTAKAGDIAPADIIIPAGNTGLPPGPAISELNDAGIRTRIETGSVWVIRETVVARKGEPIEPKVASVLSKLGIKPLEVSLKVVAAYEDGLVFTTDQLIPNLDEITTQFQDAYNHAFNLSVRSIFPTSQTIPLILQQGYLEARNLAINSAFPAHEVVSDILAKAYHQAVSLSQQLTTINLDAVPKEFRD